MAWFRGIQLLENDLSNLIIDALKRPGGYFTEAGVDMDYGVHLPLIVFDGEHFYIPSLDVVCMFWMGIYVALSAI
jgi:hypothetical protein